MRTLADLLASHDEAQRRKKIETANNTPQEGQQGSNTTVMPEPGQAGNNTVQQQKEEDQTKRIDEWRMSALVIGVALMS